jgi:hypothetical protein
MDVASLSMHQIFQQVIPRFVRSRHDRAPSHSRPKGAAALSVHDQKLGDCAAVYVPRARRWSPLPTASVDRGRPSQGR